MIAGGNPTTVVPMIVEFLVNLMLYQPELTRLLSFGVLELESGAETVCRTHVTPLFQEIQTYLLRSIAKREIAEVDAGLAAVAIVASVLAHHQAYELVAGSRLQSATPDQIVNLYTKFWLSALRPIGTQFMQFSTAQ